eukprot:CAMPEP_0204264544 /NCGR_PEP_ID=MMETSP0468-20130131/9088_1 /ASSEMBLY_ACC=CAM_ASM_000383 /TAXON_ID=2969 /ORGANISM="Oxyrrhis marina" /LENGTH=57 /DNA_ID=CAMNT_0051239419 /DNA_START=59 /DNA_END=229 /DNA_ORIENTATION=+
MIVLALAYSSKITSRSSTCPQVASEVQAVAAPLAAQQYAHRMFPLLLAIVHEVGHFH